MSVFAGSTGGAPSRPAVPPSISDYYFARYVAPLLPVEGAESVVDLLLAQAALAAERERSLSVALYGSRASELAPLLARGLLDAGRARFHLECLGASDGVAKTARTAARALGVAGHVTLLTPEDYVPRRSPGTYDLIFSRGLLHRAEEREALLGSIDDAMTRSSILVVEEPIGNPFAEAPEAQDIVDFLCSKLLPRHRTRWEPDVARAEPQDNGLLAALEERFALTLAVPFGGIADPFLDPLTGLVLEPKQSEDLRFVDFLADLELRLRESLSPTRMIAVLRKAGAVREAIRFHARGVRSQEQLVIPEEVWFDFAELETVFSHVMSGPPDAPHLAAGFHDWEADNQVRWSGSAFTIRAVLPYFEDPTRCRFVVECHEPNIDAAGGLTLFVNGARAGRIEDVYLRLHEDAQLTCEFSSQGGPVTLTCVLDHPQKAPDPVDDRELGVAVQAFSVQVAWPRRAPD